MLIGYLGCDFGCYNCMKSFPKMLKVDQFQARLYAVYAFSAIQIIKAVQLGQSLLLNEHLSTNDLILWCALDSVFCISVRLIITPRIKIIPMMVLMIGLCGLNLGLFGFGAEPVMEDNSQPPLQIDSILNQTHIRGSHTVHVRYFLS